MLLRQLRAIARAPAHITKESDHALLTRLRLEMLVAGRDPSDPYVQRASHDWMCYLERCWTQVHATQDPASQRPPAPTEPTHFASLPQPANPSSALTPGLDVSSPSGLMPAFATSTDPVLVSLHAATNTNTSITTAPTTSDAKLPHACPICPKAYATLPTLRWHMSKVHKLTMPKVRFDRAVHALQGLPICALCGASFSRWEVLEAHVTHQRCSQTLPDIPDTHSRPRSISQHALSEVACPTDTNEARDPAECITARPHSTGPLPESAEVVPPSPAAPSRRDTTTQAPVPVPIPNTTETSPTHPGDYASLALSSLRQGGMDVAFRAPEANALFEKLSQLQGSAALQVAGIQFRRESLQRPPALQQLMALSWGP